MFALSTLVTFRRASSKPTRAIRSISASDVDAGVVGRVAVEAAVAEVDAAGELAHHEQVGALDPLALERAGVEQRRAGPHRAQVGEQAEPLAQAEQALLGARRVGVGGVPLRAADGGEQHGVGAAAGVEHLVGERPCRARRSRRRRQAARRARSRRAAASTRAAAAMISGPIPSPGRVTMRGAMGRHASARAQ